jgi:Fe-S-cluster-containing dehydrogenase component
MTLQYAMVIDTRLCIGCGDCVVACKTENKVPVGLNRDWIVEATTGSYPALRTEFPFGTL